MIESVKNMRSYEFLKTDMLWRNNFNEVEKILVEKEVDEVLNKFREERQKIVDNDKIHKMILEMVSKIDEVYKEEEGQEQRIPYIDCVSTKSENIINDLLGEAVEKIYEIEEKYKNKSGESNES